MSDPAPLGDWPLTVFLSATNPAGFWRQREMLECRLAHMLYALCSHICITVCHVISSATNNDFFFNEPCKSTFSPLVYVSQNFHPCPIAVNRAKESKHLERLSSFISLTISGFSKALGLIQTQATKSSSMSTDLNLQHVPNPYWILISIFLLCKRTCLRLNHRLPANNPGLNKNVYIQSLLSSSLHKQTSSWLRHFCLTWYDRDNGVSATLGDAEHGFRWGSTLMRWRTARWETLSRCVGEI